MKTVCFKAGKAVFDWRSWREVRSLSRRRYASIIDCPAALQGDTHCYQLYKTHLFMRSFRYHSLCFVLFPFPKPYTHLLTLTTLFQIDQDRARRVLVGHLNFQATQPRPSLHTHSLRPMITLGPSYQAASPRFHQHCCSGHLWMMEENILICDIEFY